jgi:hypothetical protein
MPLMLRQPRRVVNVCVPDDPTRTKFGQIDSRLMLRA